MLLCTFNFSKDIKNQLDFTMGTNKTLNFLQGIEKPLDYKDGARTGAIAPVDF